MGQINLVRAGLPHVRDGGSFTLTSGVLSEEPVPGSSAITLVNRGIEGFAKAAALEMPRGLRINVVSPPWVTETLEVLGWDPAPGLPAARVAAAYVECVEGSRNGETLDARLFSLSSPLLAHFLRKDAPFLVEVFKVTPQRKEMPMKSTRWLVLVAPLLIVSLANAATPVPSASVVLPAAITAPAGISPACAARASQAKLPILNPAAVPATVQHCGGCSIVVCQALIVGSDCGDGRTCQQVGSDCTEDGRPHCTCA